MNKLKKQFDLLDKKDSYDNDIFYHNSEECAELTKKIAIEFHKFIRDNYVNLWGSNKYVWRHSIYIKEQPGKSLEELFNNFIEEYYGK